MREALLVKVGGSLRGAEELLEELAQYPGPLVLVHGGGPEIGALLERLGYESRFVEGLRVTPPEQMDAVEMALCLTGKRLAQGLSQRGRKALSLSGRDALCLRGRLLPGLGRVGEVVGVDPRPLLDLLGAGYTPLLAPIALDEEGPLNVNADTAAAAVAGALGWPAVFLTDVEGVYRRPKDPASRIPQLTPEAVAALKAEGVLQGGMIPKVEAALAALRAGSPWAAIAKGRGGVLEGVLKGEAGTRFYP
ncbi:MAG: acetylglutamate kinase [Thermus sp.]|uniref:acetylglutamate kinase n=1 Tax=Thermus sp. TaxID=275 RepID=UPI0025EBA4A1|nr:acetylglutamate kinase [Thermus sp.]MCS6868457.1 acetylglutamate kinase [Thermus sp.]MCS7217454.1 acetylglutamate kinase [Thermus sp.]MCX7848799.1 acetylglutamate kinase [Thermus sp.]MDW8016691.1 acetylglutamate kinase [Thermus sp.]MDW8357395.1 acetylglutamate kinase [Thermus sp.]